MKKKTLLWTTVVSCLVLCIIVSLFFVFRMQSLKELQSEMLSELQKNAGEYDEQSIVLYNTSRTRAQTLAETLGATVRISSDGHFATLSLPSGTTVLDVVSKNENIEYLNELSADYKVHVSAVPGLGEPTEIRPRYSVSDSSYELQSYLDYLNLNDAWYTSTGEGVTVAIIDTGIDTDHPEFAGRISEYSYNASEDRIVKDNTLEDGSLDWSLIEDEYGHGTSVAGVLAASMNDGEIVGIAPSVELLIIKADCDEDGNFERTSDLVFGLYYAIERDVSVVNMSFGVYENEDPFELPAQLAYDSDIICVAAAGNESRVVPCYPAAGENVIGVGALASEGWKLAEYSNYGENVDVVAPGSVYTAKMDGKYGSETGTSVAAPIVSGGLALLVATESHLTFDNAEELLRASSLDLGDLGPDWYFGYGALDISALILEERGTVTFNMMTDELDNTTQLFVRDHTLQDLPAPERLYAVFDGWYYDPQCTDEFEYYTDAFSSDLTLYANWANEEDGIPYTYVELADGTIEIRSYTGHRKYITIPDMIDGKTVSSIGEGAFADQRELREVNLPKNLVRIRRAAFRNCINLIHIEIPDTVTEIFENAFEGNVRLSSVSFGEASSLTKIGAFAFQDCARLKSFEIPSDVTSVAGSSFFGATSIRSFTVRDGNDAYCTIDGVLYNTTKSEIVCYPAGLGSSTWEDNTYVLPESVRTIDGYAFAYSPVRYVNLGNVESIEEYAFTQSFLYSVTIPDSVVYMEDFVFAESYVRSAVFGSGLSIIPYATFYKSYLASVTVPSQIVSIAGSAFQQSSVCLVKFEKNSSLAEIGNKAFYDTPLSAIEIPASVIRIGEAAFSCNPNRPYTSLISLSFEENSKLQIIGNKAFERCMLLQSVDLPESLRELGEHAFYENGLQTVTLKKNVDYIGEAAFGRCPSLSEILVDDANPVYIDIDGVVFNAEEDAVIAYPSGRTELSYVIPSTVETVGPGAFDGAIYLQTVDLSAKVKTIGRFAFYYCISAQSYELSSVLESIEESAFGMNGSLQTIDIPDSVTQIGRCAFKCDWALKSVNFTENSKLPRIGYLTFANCGLTSFRVPANVSTMAQGAFLGCSDMTEITFAENSKLDSLSAYLFDGCNNLERITFEPGSALTNVQAHALEGMRNLTTVDFGDAKITNIDNFAFRFCESLTSMTIPEGVTYLGRYAFYYCINLNSVTVPASMERIGRFAFLGAENVNIYFAASTLPLYLEEDWDHGITGYYLGVTEVVNDGVWTYAKLTEGGIAIIDYNGTETQINLTTLDFGGNIVNVGGSAFAGTAVESVVLPETVVTIQAEAFRDSALKSIRIPASVTFIGRSAFAGTPVSSVTIDSGSALRVIEQSAFEETESLRSIALPASLETLGRAVFKNSGIQSVTFADGIRITEIPQEAFAYTDLTSVSIPDSVTLLNHNAFRDTASLESVSFGGGKDVMIMSNVFYNSGLKTLTIPENVSYIGEYAFVSLPNLTEFKVDSANEYYTAQNGLLLAKNGRKLIAVPAGLTGSLTVPESVEEIGFGAFEASKLSEINFSENANILSFGYRAFYGAKNLTSIRIPASVVAIDYYAFANCTNLTTVIFAEENLLRGVYEGAFYGCENLTEITLPDSIVEISDFAFYGCINLGRIPVSETSQLKGIYDYAMAYTGMSGDFVLPETVMDVGEYAFIGNDFTTIIVPDANKEDLFIDIGAFEGNNNLSEITLPFIGSDYKGLYATWLGYIFGAGDYTANTTYVPESLKTVTVTEGISYIGYGAFFNLESLEVIHVPHSVDTIYNCSFGGTKAEYSFSNTILPVVAEMQYEAMDSQSGTGLSGHLELASGTTVIGVQAFASAGGLTSITLPDTVCEIKGSAFWACDGLRSITIPDAVTVISHSAFHSCTNLTEVKLPKNLETIEFWAFRDCNSLTSVTLPATLESIDSYAFECDFLYEVYNNSNIVLTLGSADHGCVALNAKVIVDKDGNKTYLDESTGFEYVETEDGFRFMKENGTYKLIAYLGEDLDVTLPEDIQGNSYEIYRLGGIRSIVIPEGVTSIAANAFKGCDSLISISIPSTVTSIGAYAFSGTRIEEIIVPDGIEKIEDYAFSGCNYAKKIVLPDGLKEIGNYAFYQCRSLKEITIPNTVTKIGSCAFYGDTALKSIYIPDSVISLGSSAFSYCSSLSSVVLPEGLTEIPSSTFLQCNKLVRIDIPDTVTSIGQNTFGYTGLLEIDIPDGVTFIGSQAFHSCLGLTEVVIPDSVTILQANAFTGCSNLKNVVLPENITELESRTFYGCSSLTSVKIPSKVKKISASAFQSCTSLSEVVIPESVTTISSSAFAGCTSLKSLLLPKSVTSIESGAFSGSGISQLSVASGNTAFTVVDGVMYDAAVTHVVFVPAGVTSVCVPKTVTSLKNAFKDCKDLQSVTFEDGWALTTLDDYAFYGCEGLISVVIPETVEVLGSYCFYGCSSLKSIQLPSKIREIKGAAFQKCLSMTEFSFPASVTVIEGSVLANCSSLASIDIPSTVTDIKGNAFAYCTQLKSVTLPAGIPSIPGSCFRGCTSLTSFTVPSGVTRIENLAFANCENLKEIALPDGLAYLGQTAFGGCYSLVEVVMPDTITETSNYVFQNCYSLRNVVISKGLTVIREGLFQGTELNSVTIPASVETIENHAFLGCDSLYEVYNNSDIVLSYGSSYNGCVAQYARTIVDKNGNRTYHSSYQDFEFVDKGEFRFIRESGKYKLIAYLGKEDTVTLPNDFNGEPYTVYECSGIKNLVIPSGWTVLDGFMFRGCKTLQSVVLPDTVTEINDQVFHNCSNLKTITFSTGLKKISGSAFVMCYNLESLVFPDGLEQVGGFSNCSKLENVVLPDSLKTIGYSAFYACTKLTQIDLPKNLEKIDGNAFTSSGLTEIEIPDSVTTIGYSAFENCANLVKITLPDTVKSIGYNCLKNNAYYNDPSNWNKEGALYIGKYLFNVSEEAVFVDIPKGTLIADRAFESAKKLKSLTVSGNYGGVLYGVTNLVQLTIEDLPTHKIADYFYEVPSTFERVVLKNCSITAVGLFEDLENIVIYLDKSDKDLKWDDNFPGWNNGNRVIYGDKWIFADFYDMNGDLASREIFQTSQVIRPPYVELPEDAEKVYSFAGWDLDGDGEADTVPATSTTNISAKPVIVSSPREYTITFLGKDGKTPLYTYVLPYGSVIAAPTAPTKKGYIFLGWSGWSEGMTVTGDLTFYSAWVHEDGGHKWQDPVWHDATCDLGGHNRYVCEICDEWYGTNYTPKKDHEYVKHHHEPTCTERGYDEWICECGDSYRENYTDAMGHDWGDWIEDEAAACQKKGRHHHQCGTCDHTEYEDVPAHGHDFEDEIVEDSTCIKHGKRNHKCRHCNYGVEEAIGCREHRYHKKHAHKGWIYAFANEAYKPFCSYEGDEVYYYECESCNGIRMADELTPKAAASVKSVCEHEEGPQEVLYAAFGEYPAIIGHRCTKCDKILSASVTVDSLGYDNIQMLVLGLSEYVTFEDLLIHYDELGFTVTVTEGDYGSSDYVGSGCTVAIGDKEYTILLKGDTTGDGMIDIFDIFSMVDHINGDADLEGVYKQAGLIVNEEDIDIFDMFAVVDYVNGDAELMS